MLGACMQMAAVTKHKHVTACAEYGIGKSTVRDIFKHKEDYANM